MSHDIRRITVIARPPQVPERSWEHGPQAASRLIMLDSFTVLRYAVAKPLVELDVDVERIILDRSSSASEYLALLAQLPQEFRGDVVLIRDDDSGYLSATGRGGDRVLYALTAHDVRFYLEAHGLVTPADASAVPDQSAVLQFRRRIAVA